MPCAISESRILFSAAVAKEWQSSAPSSESVLLDSFRQKNLPDGDSDKMLNLRLNGPFRKYLLAGITIILGIGTRSRDRLVI